MSRGDLNAWLFVGQRPGSTNRQYDQGSTMTDARADDMPRTAESVWPAHVPMIYGPPAWMERANCIGSSVDMVEVHGSSGTYAPICSACDVSAECIAFALATGATEGVWGGVKFGRRGISRVHRLWNALHPADTYEVTVGAVTPTVDLTRALRGP